MLISILGISLFAGIVAFIFALIGGMGGGGPGAGRQRLVQPASRQWLGLRRRLRWRLGGGGGFGGGGFGGGGGGFGGGGASGGW